MSVSDHDLSRFVPVGASQIFKTTSVPLCLLRIFLGADKLCSLKDIRHRDALKYSQTTQNNRKNK
jgi:hypothetical protein